MVSGIKRAQFGQRRPTLTLQVDRWGSRRAAVDVNRVVIDDKLAVRINALHSRKQEFRRYEGVDQKRVTVGWLTSARAASSAIVMRVAIS